jgi:ribulose-phosphate 3-epimerase
MQFDYVELMGIDEIGRQGQPFDERVLQRIRDIKAKYPDLEVSIDGSVNEDTLPRLKEAGADRFVVGSAILNAENPEAMHKKLSRLAEQEF